MNILEAYWSTKSSNLYQQNQFQKILHILEDSESECASGDIEQVTVYLFLKYNEITLKW